MPEAAWHPDPFARHELRYWDGQRWTEHVADDGTQAVDAAPLSTDGAEEEGAATDSVGDAVAVESEEVATTAADGADESVSWPAPSDGPVAGDPGEVVAAGRAGVAPMPPAAAPPTAAPEVAATSSLGPDGIGGGLLDDQSYAERGGARVQLQNPRMLKVALGPDVMIKRGSMIAYQGQMTFNYESEGGGIGGLIKRAVASDNSKMARVSGSGDLFLADDAYEVHLLQLDGGGLVVNGPNLLAFEGGMTFKTRSLGNAGIVAGGVFVTDVSGRGWVAVACHGTPVRLDTDAPTFVDAGAAVAWSSSLQVDLNVQKLGLQSMRSGELVQLAFRGTGWVLVQASEGPAVPVQQG